MRGEADMSTDEELKDLNPPQKLARDAALLKTWVSKVTLIMRVSAHPRAIS
jgi:hypothetical protein